MEFQMIINQVCFTDGEREKNVYNVLLSLLEDKTANNKLEMVFEYNKK